jgi:hypothetical protein
MLHCIAVMFSSILFIPVSHSQFFPHNNFVLATACLVLSFSWVSNWRTRRTGLGYSQPFAEMLGEGPFWDTGLPAGIIGKNQIGS